jgi:hypothetical protein
MNQDLIDMLVNKLDYSKAQAPEIAQKLDSIDPLIRLAFLDWLNSGFFSDQPEYYGYSPKSLHDDIPRLKPPAVFLLLDWIKREPLEAIEAIKDELTTK